MNQNCPFCDRDIALPPLRGIIKLPEKNPIGDESAAKHSTGSRSSSWLFSAGLLIGVLAAISGLALFSYANSLSMESTLERQLEFGRSQLDTLPPGQLWEAWDAMTRDGLPDWSETIEVKSNKQATHYSYIAYGLFAVAACGFASVIYSLATNNK